MLPVPHVCHVGGWGGLLTLLPSVGLVPLYHLLLQLVDRVRVRLQHLGLRLQCLSMLGLDNQDLQRCRW